MSPGIDPQLNAMLNNFSVEAPVQPAQIEARWSGVGIDMDWVTPMPQNQVGKYQMKPVRMNLTAPEDTVAFEVRFYLDDGQHGGKWQWPMKQHPKGHWVLEAHLGSHVHQPKPEDVWGPTAA